MKPWEDEYDMPPAHTHTPRLLLFMESNNKAQSEGAEGEQHPPTYLMEDSMTMTSCLPLLFIVAKTL